MAIAGMETGALAVGVLVLAVQAVVVARWYAAVDVPGARGGVVLAGGAAVAADLLVAARDDPHPMSPAAAVGGLAVLAALLHQLTRRDGRGRLTASLGATVTLAAVVVLAAGYVAATAADGGGRLVVAGLVGAGLVGLTTLVAPGAPAPHWLVVSLGVVVSLGATAGVLAAGDGSRRAVLGVPLAVTATAVLGWVLAARAARPDRWLSAALPVLLAGPTVFLLGRVLSS